jgi:hypothetical protein
MNPVRKRWRQMAGLVVACCLGSPALAELPVERLRLPAGFHIEVLTDQVPDARAMALGDFADGRGVVYAGSAAAGKVYGVEIDKGRAGRVHTLASGLPRPVGVAYRDGSLYVSAVSRILALDGIAGRLDRPPVPRVVTAGFPAETHHGWKFIAFGPDGWLYVPVGAPCNICEPDEKRYANIQRIRPDGSGAEVVARGVRNTVGFDWNPADGSLWFTDNGRDMLGDDLPSDELNRVSKSGEHFGYPYCHQGDLPDPEFGKGRSCAGFTTPIAKLGAHVAALGMRFYMGRAFPAAYRNSVLVAEHGSWNRSRKSGYRVVRVEVNKAGKAVRQEVFVEGWLQVDAAGKESVWGRPADVLVLPDGSLLISDDQAGAIYRVTYDGRDS